MLGQTKSVNTEFTNEEKTKIRQALEFFGTPKDVVNQFLSTVYNTGYSCLIIRSIYHNVIDELKKAGIDSEAEKYFAMALAVAAIVLITPGQYIACVKFIAKLFDKYLTPLTDRLNTLFKTDIQYQKAQAFSKKKLPETLKATSTITNGIPTGFNGYATINHFFKNNEAPILTSKILFGVIAGAYNAAMRTIFVNDEYRKYPPREGRENFFSKQLDKLPWPVSHVLVGVAVLGFAFTDAFLYAGPFLDLTQTIENEEYRTIASSLTLAGGASIILGDIFKFPKVTLNAVKQYTPSESKLLSWLDRMGRFIFGLASAISKGGFVAISMMLVLMNLSDSENPNALIIIASAFAFFATKFYNEGTTMPDQIEYTESYRNERQIRSDSIDTSRQNSLEIVAAKISSDEENQKLLDKKRTNRHKLFSNNKIKTKPEPKPHSEFSLLNCCG